MSDTATNRRILVIDDNESIHQDFRKILTPPRGSAELEAAEDVLFGRRATDVGGVEYQIDSAMHGKEGAEMVRRALLNLVLNAVDVMPDGGDLVITSYDGIRGFEIEVADSGPGLSEEDQRRVFEPFYTTKQNGTGLGLAVVYHVAEGGGYSVIAGTRYDWAEGDTFVVPSWAWHEHASEGGEAVLFSFTDRPVIEAFGFYREAAHEAGRQE